MAKLTKDQWHDAREIWECDPRDGFDWLSNHLGNVVSRQAISKSAKQQGWAKRPGQVAQLKSKSCATIQEVAQPAPKPIPNQKQQPAKKPEAVQEPEWEEVDEAEARRGGRPSMYMPHFDRQAYQLCLLGATDSHLAEFFMVTEQTINNWKKVHVTFFESIRNGKMLADAGMAERLYQRGMGYACPDTHVAVINNEIVLTELVKHYPPDTKAAFLWLKNRQPTLWRDKVEVKSEVSITPIPWDELREITKASVAEAERKHQELLATRYAAFGLKREEFDSD
ncbi:hypothetical protein [Methylomonas sp. LWB]|uniref:hypothetical protein n=1 Tax=Methylomonas sp. LWB TaxID=1905845 RepID=UPI000B2EDB1D|nr:hypothetical protein [Methylomonas sp. LWB]